LQLAGATIAVKLNESPWRRQEKQLGEREIRRVNQKNHGEAKMRITCANRVQTRIRAAGLGLALWVMVVQLGHAQTPYSVAASQMMPGLGPTGLTTLPGQNGAQQAMAQSINNVCPTITAVAATPDQRNLATICQAMTFNALQVQGQPNPVPLPNTSFGLNESQLNGALQQLNGGAELLIPTSQASVVQTTQISRQTGAIEKRLKELRNGATDTVATDSGSPGAEQLAELGTPQIASLARLAQNQAPSFAYSIGRLGVFANGFGQFGSRDPTSTENGYSFNNAGFITGADYRLTPQLVAGLAFGYSQSNTSFDMSSVSAPGQSLSGNLFQGNLYATYSLTDAWYVNAIGVIGGGNNDSQRHIVFGTNGFDATTVVTTIAIDQMATGNFGSRVAGVTLASGYDLPFGALLFTPIFRFLYQHTSVDAFNEAGAMGADLQYGSSNVNTALSFLGADAQYLINTSFGPLYPIARFHWAHQYSPGTTSVSVAYANDPTLLSSFSLPGTPTSRNYFDLGVGVSLQLSTNKSAYISYDSILGISHTSFNSFSAGIRMMF
jgi:outer membrane autotransporter protein